MTPTPAQLRAIRTTGRDLLVSAGAGSGKTAVLAHRCAYLVTEAEPRCRVDQLLVLTFTEAAAAEMRSRIAAALRERQAARPGDAEIRRQLLLLDLADISTLDAFCRRLLARHHLAAGVDPAFSILDASESTTLRESVMQDYVQFLRTGDGAATEQFENLLRLYGNGSDEILRERILELHRFLATLPDPDPWCEAAIRRYEPSAPDRLAPEWSALRRTMLLERIEEFSSSADRLVRDHAGRAGAEKWVDFVDAIRAALDGWRNRASATRSDEELDAVCASIQGFKLPTAPRESPSVKKLPDDQLRAFHAAQSPVKRWRDRLKELLIETDSAGSAADWAQGLARVAPHVRALIELTRGFRDRYAEAKRRLGRLDFSDLEQAVLQLLRTHPPILGLLRKQYEQVLVDEFQDINPLQEEIIRSVSRQSEGDRAANLFCVGDVKQSIYRFRLAEPELFMRMLSQTTDDSAAPGPLRVDLPDNFRSRPQVLDAINRIMSRLMTHELGLVDYDHRAELRAGAKQPGAGHRGAAFELHLIQDGGGAAAVVAEPDTESESGSDANTEQGPHGDERLDLERIEREARCVGARMLAMRAERPEIRWSDMAILLRSPGPRLDYLMNQLAGMGIPVIAERGAGVFLSPEVRDVRALLNLLDNEQQDIPLTTLLRSPICHDPATGLNLPLRDADLLRIRALRRDLPFHAAARDYVLNGSDAVLRRTLAAVFERLGAWRMLARRRPIADFFAALLAETRSAERAAARPEGLRRRAALHALHQAARDFGGRTRQGLHRFLRFLDELEAAGDELRGSTHAAGQEAVRILSIHQAKGLEFPYVFLMEVGKKFNFEDARSSILLDRALGPALKAVDEWRWITYPTLGHRIVAGRISDATRSEELRLLYVALTRAKECIIAIGSGRPGHWERLTGPEREGAGPLPLSQRRAAQSMLDWISDALACEPLSSIRVIDELSTTGGAADPDALFELRRISADAIETGKRIDTPSDLVGKQSTDCLAESLSTTKVSPADLESAQRAIERLRRRYTGQVFTAIPSVVAASELKRRWITHADPELPASDLATLTRSATARGPREWRRPRFTAAGAAPRRTERGVWTHLFLQHLDLSRPCDAEDLRDQLARLVTESRLTEAQRDAIDLPAIAWFFEQAAGRELRASAEHVIREAPFVLSVSPQRYSEAAAPRDPGDFLVVRGMVDCLYDREDGLALIDWKTDRITGERLEERIRVYQPQLDIYAAAASELFERPVALRRLVFLSARHIADV